MVKLDLAWNHSLPIKPTEQEDSSEKGHSWTWHGITHFLTSQQGKDGSENSQKTPRWTWHEITHCLSSQRTRVGVRTVIRHSAGPGMKSLTCCQANRIKVGVRTVRRHLGGPDEITHLLSSQQDQSENKDSQKAPSQIWYKIIYHSQTVSSIIQ